MGGPAAWSLPFPQCTSRASDDGSTVALTARLEYAAMDIVARHSQAQPDKLAVIDGEHRLTWRQYHEARNRLAHALDDLGLAAGEHVVLYAHNSLEVLLAGAAARAL